MQRNVLTAMKAHFHGSHIIFRCTHRPPAGHAPKGSSLGGLLLVKLRRSSSWGHHGCDGIDRPLETVEQALNQMGDDPYRCCWPARQACARCHPAAVSSNRRCVASLLALDARAGRPGWTPRTGSSACIKAWRRRMAGQTPLQRRRWMHPIRSDYQWTDTAAALNMSSMFRMLNSSLTMLRRALQPSQLPAWCSKAGVSSC